MRRMRRDHRWRRDAVLCHRRLDCEGRNHHARRVGSAREVASASAGMDRRTSTGLRLLPERPDHDRESAARSQSKSDRRADSRWDEPHAVPLHDLLPHPGRHQAGGQGDVGKGGARMIPSTDRRTFLKTSGMLVVGLRMAGVADAFDAASQQSAGVAAGPYPDPDFHQLDAWIVIRQDNSATFYVGKTDCGQGTGTAFRQMMADELDIAYDKTTCVMGSTDVTVDQGGSGGSDAIQTDGWPMRRVAAEARRVLLEMASTRFTVPADQLSVSEAVIT